MRLIQLIRSLVLVSAVLGVAACNGGANTNSSAANTPQTYDLQVQKVISTNKAELAASEGGVSGVIPNVNLNALAKGNNLYVVVGDGGQILTSSDGLSWSTQTTGLKINFHSVTFNSSNNLFYVVGDGGQIISSADGVSWTLYKSLTPAANLYSIAAANGNLVVGAESSTIFEINTSGRGLVTVRNTVGNMRIISAVSGNGVMVLGSNDGSLLYKYTNNPGQPWDSTNWLRATQFAGNLIQGLSYEGLDSWFLAVTNTGKVISSANGITWSTPLAVTSSGLNSIYMDPASAYFYAVGGTSSSSAILSSYDFNTWSVSPSSVTATLNAIHCFDKKDCLIVGNNGTILTGFQRDANNRPIWTPVKSGKVLLTSGQTINNANGATQTTFVADGTTSFMLQNDGNLVCYKSSIGPVWASTTNRTVNPTMGTVTMETSGNLTVVGDTGRPYTSGTNTPGAVLFYNPADHSVGIVTPDLQTVLKKLC